MNNDQNPSINTNEVHNPLSVMQADERVLCDIKRHPIGLIGTYIFVGLFVVAVAVFCFVLAPNFFSDVDKSQVLGVSTVAFIVAAVLSVGFTLIFNIIYWGNRWIVTTDSITQVQQTGLFDKQTSQLSLGNLEDVTVEQNGILTHMFNYGVLIAETAGERSKFKFIYAPNPNSYAQKILAAREQFEQIHHGGKQSPTMPTYQQPTPPPQSPVSAPPQQ